MNCFGYFCLIFILSFFRLASSSELSFERLSKLYAKYIFHSDEQMPLDKRILLRHRLTSEHLLQLENKKEKKKRECKETERNKGKAKEERNKGKAKEELEGEKLSNGPDGMEEGLLLIDFFADLEKDNEQLTAPFQQEKVRLVDICHYRTPKTGDNGLKYCWKVLSKCGKFQRDEKCDRIEAISLGKNGRDEGEQKWLKELHQEMAGVHLNCLHRLLQDSTPNSNRKVTALFEGRRGDEENVFVQSLRLVALGSKKLAEKMLAQVQRRLFELVGENKQMVEELELNWPVLLCGIDMLAWLQLFYSNVLMSNSAPTRRKAVIKLNLFAYIQSIDEFHRQNEQIRNDWCQLRKEMTKVIDSLDNEMIDSINFENQMNSWLSILYLLKKEIKFEQYTVLNREWSMVNINENNKKGMIDEMGHDWEKFLLNIRDDLTQMHYANLEKFIEMRMDFRQTFQEMSGVQLVRRLNAILGGDDPSKAIKLIRKCRQIEGVTKWFLAVHKPQFEQCSTTFYDNYQDSEAVSLSRSYEQLLLDADLFKNQFEFAHAFYSNPIVVDALLWLFSTLVDDLLMFVDGMFGLESGGYGIPLQRDTVVRDLWTIWAQLLLEDEIAEKSKKVKLCRIYSFLGMAIYKIELQICNAESADFFAFLNKIRWDRFQHAMERLNWSKNINVVPICNEDEAEKLFTELTQKQNFGLLHTRTIYTLMKRLKRLSNFFCFQAENIAYAKDRLLMLVNCTANLDWLEMKFPEILKIGMINSRHRIFLYQSILSNRSESLIAQRCKARIVVPLLFEELNMKYQFCFDYANQSEMQINDDVVNPVWDQFWLSIYPEMDTMKGICLAMFMFQFVDGLAESIAASPSEQQIEDCIGQRARLKQFQRYWELVEQKHLDFLLNGILSGSTILNLFPEGEFPVGIRPRLNNLLGTKLFSAFWHQFGDHIIDKQLFVNDIKLMDNYLATLFHQIDDVDRFAHKISADIIVFVRWLDAEPRGDKFDKIWQETKKFRLEPFYTTFYEENLDDKFRSRMHFLGELFDGIKSVLIRCRNLGIEKKLRQEWVDMEKRALKENLRWMASNAWGNAVMPKWIMKLHAKTLQKLAFGSAEKGNEKTDVLAKQFKKKLKTGLCQSLVAKHRLLNFLQIENIKEMFEKLEIEFKVKDFENDSMDKDEQTNCSDQTEKEKSKNKKKKNKNRKKKSGKGRESVQSEESEREKMQRLEPIEVKLIEEQTNTEIKKLKDSSKSNEKTIETRVKKFDANYEYDLLSIMKEPLGGMTKITIRDLKDDSFLLGKYLELMADPNKFCDRRKGGKKYGNARVQFLKYLAKWEKTRAQLELDEQLFSQFNHFSKHSRQVLGNFVENMQQIKFNIQTDLETNSLINILRENGFYALEKLKQNQIDEEFGKIKATVTKWSAGTGILLLSGSTMLKAQTSDSDIDTICIVPGHIHSDSFFGTLQCLGANERHNCDDNSFFCMLCQLPEVHSLRRLPETLVPLIRFISSFGHNFEIVFASIPDIQKISVTEVNGSRERICEMTHKLATKVKEGNLKEGEIVKTERMVRSLAAYHSNLMIAEMVPNTETFRIFVLTLKMWAKNNFIYNNLLGFLHGMPLYVLAAKICIMYPNADVPFLLERFFLTYSLWEWPLPVQLAEVRPDLLAWSAEKEQDKRIFLFGVGLYSQLSMPIITPGYPAHNSTFNVNWLTAKIIQKAMQEAFEQLQSSSANGTKWEKLLLQRRTFSDMYKHSFAINCAASSWDLCEEFCGFVGTRIRLQLMKSVECLRGEVNFCHARSVDGCPEHILHRYKARSHKASCKAWLVGIDLKRFVLPDGNEVVSPMSSKSKAQTDQNLKLDIVEPIVDSYRRVVLGELRWTGVGWQEAELGTDFVHLESKYVEREELREKWRE
uniref:polynucleotide adenylyltransferase n=1 Tax=Globodera rostochiensis TaxID=31243 RepID=A0A914HPD2_GLORO